MPGYPTIRPADEQGQGFRVLADYIEQRKGSLGIKVLRSWSGDPNDGTEPTQAQLPWVRMTPIGEEVGLSASRGPAKRKTYKCPMLVQFEIAVPGSLFDDLPSLWRKIESIIFPDPEGPGGRSVMIERLSPFGVKDITLVKRPLPTGVNAYTSAMVRGEGAIRLDFYLDV
jgi:hypothetical protein